MKKLILLILATLCAFSLFSCKDEDSEQTNPITLAAPALTLIDNVVSWKKIEGAGAYEYQINDGPLVRMGAEYNQLSIQNGESIRVRAIGDGVHYLDSAWSESVSISAPQLKKPVLVKEALPNGQISVSWTIDERAIGCEVVLNGLTTPLDLNGPMVFLLDPTDTFMVRAKGDGTSTLDSDWAVLE